MKKEFWISEVWVAMAPAVKAYFGFHLRSHPPLLPRTFALLRIQNPLLHPHRGPISISDHRFLLLSWPQPQPRILRSRRWGSNAEIFDTDGDENGGGDLDESLEQWTEALEDYIDSIRIFKVLGSFGWMLPPIVILMLLTTGLKAFLMALALSIGQSTFAFAIKRFQNRNKINPRRKTKAKRWSRWSSAYSSRNVRFKGTAEQNARREPRKEKKGYDQSWGDVSVNSSGGSVPNFGGWDELDDTMEFRAGVYGVQADRKVRSQFQKTPAEQGRRRVKWRGSDGNGPAFLRLLISMFPFLSSFTKLL